jgi:hypothetical protein
MSVVRVIVLGVIILFHSPVCFLSLYICRICNFLVCCMFSCSFVAIADYIIAVSPSTFSTSWRYSLSLFLVAFL